MFSPQGVAWASVWARHTLDPVGQAQLPVLPSHALDAILAPFLVPAAPLPVYYPCGSKGWGLDLPMV
jgi:hypothetical protein